MLPRVIDARHVEGFKLWLAFVDGTRGEVDLAAELWGPIFEPLRSVEEFSKVRVDADLDTIVWPNGADLSPTWLYQRLKQGQTKTAAAE